MRPMGMRMPPRAIGGRRCSGFEEPDLALRLRWESRKEPQKMTLDTIPRPWGLELAEGEAVLSAGKLGGEDARQ